MSVKHEQTDHISKIYKLLDINDELGDPWNQLEEFKKRYDIAVELAEASYDVCIPLIDPDTNQALPKCGCYENSSWFTTAREAWRPYWKRFRKKK